MVKLLKRGAEADIYRTVWNGSKAILKVRRPKPYRNQTLDSQLRRQRTAREAQALSHAKSFGVPAPLVYFVDAAKSAVCMQELPGTAVHDLPESRIAPLSREMGGLVGLLHGHGMMHGDLTTSNFVLCAGRVYVIDFGMSQSTRRPEDHAVDLRLIKEILNSAHAGIMEEAWAGFLRGYKARVGAARHAKILGLVSGIEARGRYANVV